MAIERYPHISPDNYQRMKRVLKELSEDGLLIRRPEKQSYFTLKERAYERRDDVNPSELGPRPA